MASYAAYPGGTFDPTPYFDDPQSLGPPKRKNATQKTPWGTDPLVIGGGGGADPFTGPRADHTSQWDTNFNVSPEYGRPPTGHDMDPNGVFSGPGYDEQYWLDNKDKYSGPTDSQNYWDSVSGKFNTGPTKSTGAADAYQDWFTPLKTPGYTEKYAAGGGPQFSGYDQQGFKDTSADRTTDYTGRAMPDAVDFLGRDTKLENQANSGAGYSDLTRDAGAAFDRFFDPLSDQSNSEKLYGQDPGLKTYYDRAQETGQEQIDKAAAARGLFSSGAALDENRQLTADLGADRAKNEADYKLRAAGQSDAERRARMGLAGQLGGAADASNVANNRTKLDWLTNAANTGLKRNEGQRAWADQGDRNAIARSAENRGWADLLSGDELKQNQQKLDTATAADKALLGRSGESRNWADLLDNETKTNNDETLNYLKGGSDIANNADNAGLNKLNSGMNAASQANSSLRQRYQDQFNNLMKVAETKSGLVSGGVDAATKQKINSVIETLKAELGSATNANSQSQFDQQKVESDLALLAQLTA